MTSASTQIYMTALNNNEEKQTEYVSIAEIFERARELYPQRPALVIAEQTWTYSELGNLVDAAAFRLKKVVTTGDRIAIIGMNHLSYIVAYWATQRLGCSTVEINRNEPLKTVLGFLAAAHTRFVVTDRNDLKLAIQGELPAESFEEFLERSNGGAIEAFRVETSNSSQIDDEASIVYTSGTTAKAKGVVLSHGNFCFIARAVANYLELTEEDRCALTLPLCHTYGKSVLLSAFASGAAVVVLDGFGYLRKCLTQLTSEGCTVLSAVPYNLHTLVNSGSLLKYDFSSLRAITSSSDKLSPSMIDILTKALPNVRIFSMYGLTESTTRACYVPPEFLQKKKDSCGRPLPGVEIRIVMEDGASAPAGVSGEILLRGPNIMRGYFGDEELTKATIVDGWLKTGDIGHLDDDGFLYIDGRRKDIIKCAGERINPLEIEEVLMEHPDVEEAAVVGRPDSLMGETIHAYVTACDPSLKIDDLRKHCYARLSPLKVPYEYTFVESFPRTGTGKIQKNILGSAGVTPAF
jgi:acyl-CoA synthetase (AMP-forming)/AMP-acid ligase II